MTRPARWAPAAGAAAVVLLACAPGPARAAGSSPAAGGTVRSAAVVSGVKAGRDSLTLLSQSSWVTGGQVFRLRLAVTARDPAGETLTVRAFSQVTTRSGYDQARAGHVSGYALYETDPLALTSLTPDPAGGVDIDIPVDRPSTQAGVPELYAGGASEIVPLQVAIDRAGVPQGSPLTTFLVYAAGPPSKTGFPKLSVAVVLPFGAPTSVGRAGQPSALPAGEAAGLGSLARILDADRDVPVSLEVTPETLDALAAGGPAERAVLSGVVDAVRNGRDEVLPEPYVGVSPPAMEAAGLGGDFARQVDLGSSDLGRRFGTPPARATWATGEALDDAGLGALEANGARHLILPDQALTALPAPAVVTTFARPTPLAGTGVSVFAADPGITADFTAQGGPALAASDLLADMAMIQLESPSLVRGVAVMAPRGWTVNPTFVAVLLAGLRGNPLLAPVTAAGLFAAVPLDTSAGDVRGLSPAAGDGGSGLAGVAPSLRSAARWVAGFESVLGDQQRAAVLRHALLTAEASDLTAGQRQAIVEAVVGETRRALQGIVLPGPSSITLTSTRSRIPLTVMASPALHAHVELRLSSGRLIFERFSPAHGRCSVPTPTSEMCDLTLVDRNTTLKVPVQARASGVFSLDVALWSPDGSQLLVRERDTVRSTAVSDVGIVLIVLALASLAIWWGRDLRHGRRARALVPVPEEEPPEEPGGEGSGGEGSGAGPAADGGAGGVEEFFATPPPPYREPDAPLRP